MARRQTVGIVGGGSWGTALAHLIGTNGRSVRLWMRDPAAADALNATRVNARYFPELKLSERIVATSALKSIGAECQLVLVVVPSAHLRPVMHELGEHLDGSHLLVHGVKGLEAGTFKRMSTILKEETACKKIGVLSGPNLAREVAEGQPSAAVVASRYREVVDVTREALLGSTFRIYGNTDVVGTELGGALKNVLAIASGLANGLGFGENTKAMLLTRGLAEIARLGVHLGAAPATFSGLSGLGDMLATCFSPLSRNYQVGARLACGESLEAITQAMQQVAEGVKTARVVHEYAQAEGLYMPITEGVYRILYEGVPPRVVLSRIMDVSRNVYELDPEIRD